MCIYTTYISHILHVARVRTSYYLDIVVFKLRRLGANKNTGKRSADALQSTVVLLLHFKRIKLNVVQWNANGTGCGSYLRVITK